jgi:hypothetical protein
MATKFLRDTFLSVVLSRLVGGLEVQIFGFSGGGLWGEALCLGNHQDFLLTMVVGGPTVGQPISLYN